MGVDPEKKFSDVAETTPPPHETSAPQKREGVKKQVFELRLLDDTVIEVNKRFDARVLQEFIKRYNVGNRITPEEFAQALGRPDNRTFIAKLSNAKRRLNVILQPGWEIRQLTPPQELKNGQRGLYSLEKIDSQPERTGTLETYQVAEVRPGIQAHFTRKELLLFKYLYTHPDEFVSYEELINATDLTSNRHPRIDIREIT